MNWIDYVIFVSVIFTTIIGLWRGFVYEIIAFIIWIAAFAIAAVVIKIGRKRKAAALVIAS